MNSRLLRFFENVVQQCCVAFCEFMQLSCSAVALYNVFVIFIDECGVFCYRGLFAWRLKKKVFSDWVTLWWEARKEWALCIRAELHYRFVDVLVTDLKMWTVNKLLAALYSTHWGLGCAMCHFCGALEQSWLVHFWMPPVTYRTQQEHTYFTSVFIATSQLCDNIVISRIVVVEGRHQQVWSMGMTPQCGLLSVADCIIIYFTMQFVICAN